MKTLQRLIIALVATILPTAGASAIDAPNDPAVQQIDKFYGVLLGVMKEGPQLGIEGRFKKLAPQIDATFDLAAMTKFAVGPSWSSMSQADQKALIDAFRRLTIANYARNFDSFSGQKFVVDPAIEDRSVDRLVRSQLVQTDDDPVSFTYRMRQAGGTWKVIDVFLEGYVSELSTRRSEFASTVQSAGAPGLIRKLNELSDKLMKPET